MIWLNIYMIYKVQLSKVCSYANMRHARQYTVWVSTEILSFNMELCLVSLYIYFFSWKL